MRNMTFEDYDKLCEKVKRNPYQCLDWWPSPEELKEKMGGDFNQSLEFLTWILETNRPPQTEEEKASQRYINKIMRENLNLY